MLNKNVSNTVESVAKGVLKGVAMLLVVGCLSSKNKKCKTTMDSKYSDAVDAITNSAMFSNDKAMAVSALPTNETIEFYKAVIYVAESSLYSSDKLKSILNMCNQTEEV